VEIDHLVQPDHPQDRDPAEEEEKTNETLNKL
jgi:hypothetical protein